MKKITTIITFLFVILLQAQNFTGTWSTTFGDLKLIHQGQTVYGDYGTKGIIDAIQTGSTINGKFTNAGKVGEFYFKLASDNKSFTGEWRWQGETTNRGNWTGTLKSDAFPSLKMDKWSGQYEFKSYPNGFIKKLNLQQKGFSLEGKFEDGKSFIGKLSNDLKTISNASLYHGNTLYNITTGIIKSENSEHITVWYGDIKASNTSTTIKFSAKFLKPMTVAEFASATGGSNYSNTNYNSTNNVSGSATQVTTNTNASTNNKDKTPSHLIKYPKPIKPVSSFTGNYKVTITKIYFPKDAFGGLEGDEIEVYGTAGIRAYSKLNGTQVEIKSKGNMPSRVLDISESNTSRVKRKWYDRNTNNVLVYEYNRWKAYRNSNDTDWLSGKWLEKEFTTYGSLIVDRSREFQIDGDLANKDLEFNIQVKISEEDGAKDDNYVWQQISLNIKDVDLEPTLEYLCRVRLEPYNNGNRPDLKDCYIGFKIEKY